jgi:cytochrome P450
MNFARTDGTTLSCALVGAIFREFDFTPPERQVPLLMFCGARFNGGPRICPGQQFALTEAAYVLARLMQHVESIERRDVEYEWTERVALVTKVRNGVKVALKMAEKS